MKKYLIFALVFYVIRSGMLPVAFGATASVGDDVVAVDGSFRKYIRIYPEEDIEGIRKYIGNTDVHPMVRINEILQARVLYAKGVAAFTESVKKAPGFYQVLRAALERVGAIEVDLADGVDTRKIFRTKTRALRYLDRAAKFPVAAPIESHCPDDDDAAKESVFKEAAVECPPVAICEFYYVHPLRLGFLTTALLMLNSVIKELNTASEEYNFTKSQVDGYTNEVRVSGEAYNNATSDKELELLAKRLMSIEQGRKMAHALLHSATMLFANFSMEPF